MSRPIRFQASGLVYHVMARGNNKMRIFLDDLDHARFAAILAHTRQTFALDVWVTCAMPNHYHLVLRTRQPNLSLAIAHLNGTYAQWWNKRHGRVGHVYQGRFKAQIVDACTYLLRLCRYVLMNPVRGGLVAYPWEWRWSSYHALANDDGTVLDLESLTRAIDPDQDPTVRARLLEYIDNFADEEIANFLRRDRRVIGSAAFAAQFKAQARAASTEVPARERRIGTPPLATLLADALARGDGLHGGVREAYASLYPVQDIAACAGLSARTVARLVSIAGPPVRKGGTRARRSIDLAPSAVEAQT